MGRVPFEAAAQMHSQLVVFKAGASGSGLIIKRNTPNRLSNEGERSKFRWRGRPHLLLYSAKLLH
jgi:hypothetical protein